jgi:ubiquinone/menaquinone biosynthesis C-methylase UbiE
MAEHICPWWLGYFHVLPIRRLLEPPERIVGPHVRAGMRVLDVGCGMGYFTLPMAAAVGAEGKVVTLDVQPRMLAGLARRARRAGLADRIDARLCAPDSLGIDDLAGRVDFALLYAVVHEVPDPDRLFAELRAALRSDARVLVAEPAGHVTQEQFAATLTAASRQGLRAAAGPDVAGRRRHTALLEPAP